jgi:arylsulfatase A-like enzyme
LTLSRPGPPNHQFNTLDTVRADHVGLYGYPKPTTPHIDAFFSRGVVFEQARSTGPSTRFAIPPLLSGRYYTELDRTWGHWPKFDTAPVLLQEHLKAAGYATAGVHSVEPMRTRYGLVEGYDHLDTRCVDPMDEGSRRRRGIPDCAGWKEASSAWITDQALKMADREGLGERRPWFLWVYYSDPHGPYIRHRGVPRFGGWYRDRYDQEIAYTDQHIGRLLAGLEERGMLTDTVVVLFSDHGEGLDRAEDHGHKLHSYGLWDNLVKVPLAVRAPGVAPRRVATPVSLLDVGATALALAGIAVPADHRGVSLEPWLRGEERARGPLFFEKHRSEDRPQKAMLAWPYKVIVTMDNRRAEIFDLAADPGEQRDLRYRGLDPAVRDRLIARFWQWHDHDLKPAKDNFRN